MSYARQTLQLVIHWKRKNLLLAALVALAFLLGVGVKSYASETLRIFHPASFVGTVEAGNFQLTVISLLTLLNFGLVVAGIYGVMAQSIGEQTPAIGLRLMNGAKPREVLTLVVLHGLKLVIMGSVIGLGVAFLFARWIKVVLFGVEASDPFTFAGVAVVLGVVAFVAAYLPARRTPEMKPIAVLHK